MNQKVLELRKLVDELVDLSQRISHLNDKISDADMGCDLLICLNQHRHTFEEQNVTSHDNCLCHLNISGEYAGIVGGMMFMSDRNKMFKRAISETYLYNITKRRR